MTSGPSGAWPDGFVRVFLSHSAKYKAYAAEVAAALLPLGISGFVAHDSMEVTKPWQEQIEAALGTAEAFVILLHPEVNESAFCQQEVGWALGRGLPIFVVRVGADPRAFLGGIQWPSAVGKPPSEVAPLVAGWLNSLEGFGERVAGGLLAALAQAGDYYSAEAAGQALSALGRLTPPQWEELDRVVLGNSQVGGSVLATRALRPLYDRWTREWPRRR